MKLTLSRVGFAIAAAGALFIYGCGGSGGGSATATSSSLTGTAATGAALAGANVAITNKAGTSPCTESSIITTALGSYTCTLKSGETAPFFIVVYLIICVAIPLGICVLIEYCFQKIYL